MLNVCSPIVDTSHTPPGLQQLFQKYTSLSKSCFVSTSLVLMFHLECFEIPIFRPLNHSSNISSSKYVYENPVSHSSTPSMSAVPLQLVYKLLCAYQEKSLSKILKAQQVAFYVAVSMQLYNIGARLPVHLLCFCVCLALGKIIYALSSQPSRIVLRPLFGLVFWSSVCFHWLFSHLLHSVFLMTMTLVSGLPGYGRRCPVFWLLHFVLCLVSWPEMWGSP